MAYLGTHVLIVPGSFSPPAFYTDLIASLAARSIPASTMSLTTVAPISPPAMRNRPASSMYADAAAVAAEVRRLNGPTIGAGPAVGAGKVLVVAHSYAGTPASQAFDAVRGGLEAAEVAGLVYLASVVPPLGLSALVKQPAPGEDPFAGAPFTRGADGYLVSNGSLGAGVFSSQSPERAEELAEEYFATHSAQSFLDPLTHAGWRDVAAANKTLTWIRTTEDKVVPPEAQDGSIKRINDDLTADGREGIKVKRIATDHCPNVTAPDELADAIKEIIEGK